MNLDVFLEALPPKLVLDYGVQVEERGFRAAWFPEITFGDSFGPGVLPRPLGPVAGQVLGLPEVDADRLAGDKPPRRPE